MGRPAGLRRRHYAGNTAPGTLAAVAQSKQEIRALLGQIGRRPNKALGQNFMIDMNLVRLVAEAGEIAAGDLVIEVGPGTGTLTEEILSRGGRVVAVEMDGALAELLGRRFAGQENFTLIEGDALAGKHLINGELLARLGRENRPARLVANLPFNIASPLVIELLIAGVELLAFTVQKEVANRLKATAGDEAYGPLSVMAGLLSRVEVLRSIPPAAFWPAPNVASTLTRMRRQDRLGNRAREFGVFVHQLFGQRRKMLKKSPALAGVDAVAVLRRLEIEPEIRPEELTAEQCLQIFEAI